METKKIKPVMYFSLPYFESNKKRIIRTNIELATNRSIKAEKTDDENFKFLYYVTLNAFEKLKEQYELIYDDNHSVYC